MLSRVADSLYWMSRYLERAEHTARVLDVNLHGMLDQKTDILDQRWKRVRRSLHANGTIRMLTEPLVIARTLSFDPSAPGSIINSISSARQNAREVREQISSEMWEQLNRLYLYVQNTKQEDFLEGDAHDFLQTVRMGAHLFQGISDGTMSHEEGWHFIQLGRYLERVIATVSLLDAHFSDYQMNGEAPATDQYLEWVGLLKTCTAFEAYCRVHTANVFPEKVATFLLLDSYFPHAVRFGVRMVLNALNALAETTPALKQSVALRLVGKTASSLNFDPIEDIMAQGIHAYLTEIREHCIRIHQAIYDACITYPIEFALTA